MYQMIKYLDFQIKIDIQVVNYLSNTKQLTSFLHRPQSKTLLEQLIKNRIFCI